MSVSAIIPIKYNSSRVPGKNFKLMNGKPLFYYIINTLLKCDYINHIIINTDSDIIIEKINEYFSTDNIIFYKRPVRLTGDDISVNKLIEDTLLNVNIDSKLYLQTHVTNPLLSINTIEKAIQTFNTIKDKHDSLFSVKTLYTRLYDKDSKAVNHNPHVLIPTQDLDPLYEENSCMYIFSKEGFMGTCKRIGNNPYLFKMNNFESQDIDRHDDFYLTELLMKQQNNIKKVILITGINGGIGSFLGNYFKKRNWTVIGVDIKDDKNSNCDVFFKYDISNEAEIKKMVYDLGYYEKIDVLVNNAAYQLCKKWIDSSSEEWDKVINSNLKSVFLLSKYLYPKLKEAKGSIINVSSVHATHTSKHIGIYATSKGGMTTLTRSMAIEFGENDIRVNAILPGAINTKMLQEHFNKDKIEILKNKHIPKRIGEPLDVAEMVNFLADNNKSGFITGQCLYIDGGATIKLSTES